MSGKLDAIQAIFELKASRVQAKDCGAVASVVARLCQILRFIRWADWLASTNNPVFNRLIMITGKGQALRSFLERAALGGMSLAAGNS
jgi:hypothetical protein